MDTAGTVIFQTPHPLVPLTHRDGEPRAVSWNGFSFPPDERGINWLPVEAVSEMTSSHGMVGVPGAVASDPKHAPLLSPQAGPWGAGSGGEPGASSRELYIAELEASNAMLRAHIAELDPGREQGAPADPAAAKGEQTSDGGAVRPTIFPAEGDHPLGGPQPALQDPPIAAEVAASASAPAAKVRKS
jgi:hypothetical protein